MPSIESMVGKTAFQTNGRWIIWVREMSESDGFLTPKGLGETFAKLVRELGAEYGTDGYYKGIVAHAPFLLKTTKTEPIGFLLKVRCLPNCYVEDVWQENISDRHPKAGIKVERDDEYLYLWIDNPGGVASDDLIQVVRDFLSAHATGLPSSDDYCFSCSQVGFGVLRQSAGSVATICPDCLTARENLQAIENTAANPSDTGFLALFPLGVLIGMSAWAGFWAAYDAAFRWAQNDRLYVPTYGALAVVGIVGYGIGWPVGRILFRSGIARRLPPVMLSIGALFLIVFGGEALFDAWFIFRVTGHWDAGLAIRAVIPFIAEGGVQYVLYKLLLAIMAGAVISNTLRPKVQRLRL